MKRTLAAMVLLAALGMLVKIALKPDLADPSGPTATGWTPPQPVTDNEADLISRYPTSADLVHRVYGSYRQNALAIERSDGLRGLTLLDALGVEAIYLYEQHPGEFSRLRDTLGDASAAEILLHWRDYFGFKQADDTDRNLLITEIARLGPTERRVAARYPNALPLILTDPVGVVEMVNRWSGDASDLDDALALLTLIDLAPGATDLQTALRTLDEQGPMALDAFRSSGLDGFALVKLYGGVLGALGRSLPLDQALILLRVNSDYIDELLASHTPATVAGHLRHVAAVGLIEQVGGNPDALRLIVEFGERGERALMQAGPDAADVVFQDFHDATLRHQAVNALAMHGPMALAMLDKYAMDADFQTILARDGAAIIPPIARTDTGPEALSLLKSKPRWNWSERLAHTVLNLSGDNGQATIKMIKKDGLGRVAELNSSDVGFAQFLPLYDLLHLANVARRGQSPTAGEMTWALVDGCFVVADVLSLAALQPEGVVAAEASRAEVRTAVRRVATSAGRNAVEAATTDAAQLIARRGLTTSADSAATTSARLARWWAVRAAGGTYPLLRRLPEALPKLTIGEIADLGRGLCRKASLRLSTWEPLRLAKDGREIFLRIPPERGLKYLGVQAAQASVGVIGFRKMEEHLSSRRSQHQEP